jgi:AhpD family alkylhydroperoxidase
MPLVIVETESAEPGPTEGDSVMTHFHDVISELRQPTRELKDAIPDAWAGFAALHEHALAAGALPAHVKELVALAIAVSKECDGCIAYHARGAAMKGASREELAEVLAVALLMNGGPASVYGPRAWAAFDEFAPPTAEAS